MSMIIETRKVTTCTITSHHGRLQLLLRQRTGEARVQVPDGATWDTHGGIGEHVTETAWTGDVCRQALYDCFGRA